MKKSYKILYQAGEGEIVEKKSRFIATIRPADSEEEALSFIAEMRKKYWDATHNCTAFVIGENHEQMRCNDDGEPSQTAGRPMLDVLLGEDVHNCCAVVTRYFGGTLLGTGGLVRAYSAAVKEGLRNCQILEKQLARKLTVETDYTGLGKIQYILGEEKISTLDSQYADKVSLTLLVPVDQLDPLMEKLTEGTNGRCVMEPGEQVWYGLQGKEIVFLSGQTHE
ncbi:MAG: YigZ family protein [Clostridium sp.]